MPGSDRKWPVTDYIPARDPFRKDRKHVIHARAVFGLYALCGVRSDPIRDPMSGALLNFADLLPTCPACKDELRRIDAARRDSE